jgi:peptidoglycan-associated lipoprotein
MNRAFIGIGVVAVLAACHPKFPTCREDSDCLDADNHGLQVHCLDGQCQECRTDAECAIGKKCESMRCVAGSGSTIPTTPPEPAAASNAGSNNGGDNACQFPKIHFDYNSSALTPQSMQALQQVVSCLTNRPNLHLLIEGDCDERGTEEYNLALGQRRATNVEKYLEGLGVQRISTISYGKDKPVCTDNTEACMRENRRAEFDIARK